MPEANPSLEQCQPGPMVCEELSEKRLEVEKLKLKQSEDLERFIQLDQYLQELLKVTVINREQLQSKDQQIAELHQKLLNQAQQDGASRGEGGGEAKHGGHVAIAGQRSEAYGSEEYVLYCHSREGT
eukprot:gene28979-32167_t